MMDLDGVSTAPPLPEVLEAMAPWQAERHANPAAPHARGREAARAIDTAREAVASLVGVAPGRVVFCSGVTEANNLAIKGLAGSPARNRPLRIAVGAHEPPSLVHPARTVCREHGDCRRLRPARDGRLTIAADEPFDLLALSHAHPELGTLQPVAALAQAARARGARLLVDAALTAGRMPLDLAALGQPEFLTLSFHHLGGPAGVGALIADDQVPLAPLIEGGTQERGYRAGTPYLAGCVGAGVAAERARRDAEARAEALRGVAALLAGLLSEIPGLELTGPPVDDRLPGHVSATVPGIDGAALLVALEHEGILAATASPCAAAAGLASAALRAAGFSQAEARGALLLCVPPTALPAEQPIRHCASVLRHEIARLLALAGPMAGA